VKAVGYSGVSDCTPKPWSCRPRLQAAGRVCSGGQDHLSRAKTLRLTSTNCRNEPTHRSFFGIFHHPV
jgi:hypothetical protein